MVRMRMDKCISIVGKQKHFLFSLIVRFFGDEKTGIDDNMFSQDSLPLGKCPYYHVWGGGVFPIFFNITLRMDDISRDIMYTRLYVYSANFIVGKSVFASGNRFFEAQLS